MKHLNSKILAAIVACSATMLFSGMTVHAANVNQRPGVVRNSRTVTVNPSRTANVKPSASIKAARDQIGRRYTYRNLRAVKASRNSTLRLGGRHSKRTTNRISKLSAVKKRRRPRRVRWHAVRRSRQKARRNGRHGKRVRPQSKRRRGSKNPKLVYPREHVINQKKSAVNRFSKHLRYVNNQQPANFTSSENYGDSDYARVGTPVTGTTNNGDSITFHRLTFIPKKLGDNQFYSPQGLVIAGHDAYVITNATNSYEASHNQDSDGNRQAPSSYVNGDDSTGTSPYRIGASQIIRINLNRHVKDYNNDLKAAHRNIKAGPVFYGGHGQGLAYNPKTKQLWLLNNKAGQVTKTAVSRINPWTLVPNLRINFHFGDTTIGDDLAFNRNGQAVNVTEAGSDSFAKPGAVKFFAGNVNPRSVHMRLIKQGLRWAPSDVIQGLTYNPRNNRLYILGDDSITSVPADKLGRLGTDDVWNTQFDTTREFEGLSFDRAGNGYLLVSRSPEIMEAKYDRSLKF